MRPLALLCVLCFVPASFAAEPAAADPVAAEQAAAAKKMHELAWAKGVAEDFLEAICGFEQDQVAVLMSSELRKEIVMQSSLDHWVGRVSRADVGGSAKITEEQIAPDIDEASFRGTLQGSKKTADFSTRLVKDKESGKWRVIFFRFKERP
jgi:hypothetical protein